MLVQFYCLFRVAPFGSVGENNPVFFVCIDPIETRKHKQLCRQSDTEPLDSSRTISLGPVRFDRHRSKRTNTTDAVHAHSTSRRNINNPWISGALKFPYVQDSCSGRVRYRASLLGPPKLLETRRNTEGRWCLLRDVSTGTRRADRHPCAVTVLVDVALITAQQESTVGGFRPMTHRGWLWHL